MAVARNSLARGFVRMFVLALTFCVVAHAFAEPEPKWTWTRTATPGHDDRGQVFLVDATGNSYMAGGLDTDAGSLIVKLDPSGNLLWSKSIDDGDATTEDGVFSMKLVPSGALYACGILGNQAFVIKLDANGNELWRRTYAPAPSTSSFARNLAIDSSGGVAICGWTRQDGVLHRDHWIANRYDSNGNLLWAKQTHGGDVFNLAFDSGDNLIVLGGNEDVDAGFDPPNLTKYDTSGNIVFDFWGGTMSSRIMLTDASDNIYLAARNDNAHLQGIQKFNPSGQLLYTTWLDADTTKTQSFVSDAKFDASGNIFVVGGQNQSIDNFDTYTAYRGVWKLNSSGTILWARPWLPPTQPGNDDSPSGFWTCSVDGSGNVYSASGYATPTGPSLLLRKLDKNGNAIFPANGYWFVNSTMVIPGIANVGVGIDNSGNIYEGGDSFFWDQSPSAFRITKIGESLFTGLTFNPTFIIGSAQSTATVTMVNPAPAGGLTLNLSSTAGATTPPSVQMAAGSNQATFLVTGSTTSSDILQPVISVSVSGSTKKAKIAVYPANSAQFVSQTVAASMNVGKTYTVTLQYKNTGVTTWDAAHNYALQSRNATNNMTWGLKRLPLTNAPVAPGATGIFSATVTAPSVTGNYNFQWIPIEDSINAGFGSLSPNLSIAVVDYDDATFVSRSGVTTVYAGALFTAQYTMKNTGTKPWSTANGYSLMTVAPNNNTLWGINRIAIPGGVTSVAAGAQVTFSGTCAAPVTPGNYAMQWQVDNAGTPFGTASPATSISVVVGSDLAQYISENIPQTVFVGATFTARVTMKNTGEPIWTQGGGYCLISQGPLSNKLWGTNRLLIPSGLSFGHGQSVECQNILTAPLTPGNYFMQWQMSKNGVPFGDLTPALSINVIVNPDNASYVSQKPFTRVAPGAVFSANVTMHNTGTSTWTQATGYSLLSQDPTSNTIWGTNRLLIPSAATVVPGGQVICSNTLTAPSTPGTYTMRWRMYHNGVLFGEQTAMQTITVSLPGDAIYLTEFVPTSVVAGSTFTVKVVMQNTGTTTWTQAGGYCLESIFPDNNVVWGTNRLLIPSSVTVLPGQTVTLFNTCKAPSIPSHYLMAWRMSCNGVFFGLNTASPSILVTAS